MGAFEYRQATEIRDALARHGVRHLFIGKSGAILLGFPDTTQDADVFVEKSKENCRALADAIESLGFALSEAQRKTWREARTSSNSRARFHKWLWVPATAAIIVLIRRTNIS
jgi:predicted nucleotidyltransferase